MAQCQHSNIYVVYEWKHAYPARQCESEADTERDEATCATVEASVVQDEAEESGRGHLDHVEKEVVERPGAQVAGVAVEGGDDGEHDFRGEHGEE